MRAELPRGLKRTNLPVRLHDCVHAGAVAASRKRTLIATLKSNPFKRPHAPCRAMKFIIAYSICSKALMTSEFDALVRSELISMRELNLDVWTNSRHHLQLLFLVTALGYFCPYTIENYEISWDLGFVHFRSSPCVLPPVKILSRLMYRRKTRKCRAVWRV